MTTQRNLPTLFTLVSLGLGTAALGGCDSEPGDGLDGELELDSLVGDSDGEQPDDSADETPLEPAGSDDLSGERDYDATVSPAINLALGMPTTQSTTAFGGDSSRAVDGNTDGYYWNDSVSHTDLGVAGWWQVDLLSVEPVGEIVIHNRTDCCALLADFDVLVSADGVSWETFHRSGVAGDRTRVLIDRPARYVRIDNPTTLHMAEVEVFRTRNLALGKPTTQSGTGFGGDPGRAVDGNTDGDYGHGSVSHTAVDGPGQWWQVDLESIQNIGQVAIFNRTDCCAAKLHDFTVSVSNDGVNWEGLEFDGAAGQHVLVPINRDARYLRIDNGDGYLHLAEVQVFEAPRLPGLSYGRGVGTIPSYGCEPGDQYDAGLCYTPCAPGYTNALHLCYEDCAPGYNDVLGLQCVNGESSYWKHIYDRGVGTFPVATCAPGEDLDAGLCYEACDVGFHGVGPVCWLDGITIEDIGGAACDMLRLPIVSHLAEDSGVALTSGVGITAAVVATASAEIGVAYGPEGEFGCYASTCGGFSTDVGLSVYAVMGAYDEFSHIEGPSLVASGGLAFGIPETPISLGGSLGLVTDAGGTPIGSTISAIVGLGLDDTQPVGVGVGGLSCQTGVLQTQP